MKKIVQHGYFKTAYYMGAIHALACSGRDGLLVVLNELRKAGDSTQAYRLVAVLKKLEPKNFKEEKLLAVLQGLAARPQKKRAYAREFSEKILKTLNVPLKAEGKEEDF